MGKYTTYRTPPRPPKRGMNPLWRGVGCLLIVFVPALAFGLTVLLTPVLVASGYIPLELLARVQLPDWFYQVSYLGYVANFIAGIDNLYLKLIEFFVILVLLTGISTLLYTAIYQAVGPARYGKLDEPPSSHKPKVYKR